MSYSRGTVEVVVAECRHMQRHVSHRVATCQSVVLLTIAFLASPANAAASPGWGCHISTPAEVSMIATLGSANSALVCENAPGRKYSGVQGATAGYPGCGNCASGCCTSLPVMQPFPLLTTPGECWLSIGIGLLWMAWLVEHGMGRSLAVRMHANQVVCRVRALCAPVLVAVVRCARQAHNRCHPATASSCPACTHVPAINNLSTANPIPSTSLICTQIRAPPQVSLTFCRPPALPSEPAAYLPHCQHQPDQQL